MRLALFTFGIFRQPAEHSVNAGFHARNDAALAAAEQADGFIARSGYDNEPGPPLWGLQVYPDFYAERGDGWSPETLSLWEDLESVAAFTYHGLHAEAQRLGRTWFVDPEWPPYVLWWVGPDHTPDWAEAVGRHRRLHTDGSTPDAFNFSTAFNPDGQAAKLDTALVAQKSRRNAERLTASRAP
ncbi:MAG: DUF3291 domain-containing protein [Hyphomicrobiales bacterium]|nr:MAG: DUF3291 domain-containing protein [Hyphomicrobiales bacterium]